MTFPRQLGWFALRSAYLVQLGFPLLFCSVGEAQISIVNSGAGSNAVNVAGAYVQNFNSLTNADHRLPIERKAEA